MTSNLLAFRLPKSFALAAGLTFMLIGSASAAADFFATHEADGDLLVVDASGVEVTVVASDPVGTRPEDCPSGGYYVAELPEDLSQLVLSDCATGQGQYTVEILGSD